MMENFNAEALCICAIEYMSDIMLIVSLFDSVCVYNSTGYQVLYGGYFRWQGEKAGVLCQ